MVDVRKVLIIPSEADWKQQCTEYSDCLREGAVVESGCGGTDAPVPPIRCQEGKKSMRGVQGVFPSAGGIMDAAVVER